VSLILAESHPLSSKGLLGSPRISASQANVWLFSQVWSPLQTDVWLDLLLILAINHPLTQMF